MNALFIYRKDGQAIVLSEDAKKDHAELIKDGWQHTSTIAPKMFMQSLLNQTKSKAVDMLKRL